MEKHTPYFKVLETLQKTKTCALCFLEKEAFHAYIESFLYENVNNPVSRNTLQKSRGYCSYHTYYLMGFHDPLAFSILYKDQALFADAFLEKSGLHKSLFDEWLNHDTCPACLQRLTIRSHYVGILAHGLRDDQMRSVFLDHFHICFQHFLLVMDQISDVSFKKELSEKMRCRLKLLAKDQEQYCQDCQTKASESEFDSIYSYSWKEAVEILVGEKDVFEALLKEK